MLSVLSEDNPSLVIKIKGSDLQLRDFLDLVNRGIAANSYKISTLKIKKTTSNSEDTTSISEETVKHIHSLIETRLRCDELSFTNTNFDSNGIKKVLQGQNKLTTLLLLDRAIKNEAVQDFVEILSIPSWGLRLKHLDTSTASFKFKDLSCF